MSNTPVLGPYGHYNGCPSLGGLGCNCAERDALAPVRAIYDASTDPVPRLEQRDASGCYGVPGGCGTHRTTPVAGTPSTMLGEAFDLLARVRDIMQSLKHYDIDARLMHEQETIGSLRHVTQREADARDPKP